MFYITHPRHSGGFPINCKPTAFPYYLIFTHGGSTMSLNHCYQFWSNTVNLYSKLGFLGFISVFGVGHQSKLTRDVIPSYINILLVIHPIEAIETAYHHQTLNQQHPTCASLSQAWRDQENRNWEKKEEEKRYFLIWNQSPYSFLRSLLKPVLISRTDHNVYAQTL